MNQEYEQNRSVLRLLVRTREDYQAMRKCIDNRIGRKADGKDQKITERCFLPEDLVMLKEEADEAKIREAEIEKKLKKILKRFSVYTQYLSKVKGVGPVASGHIISSFSIEEATTVSKMWQYAGLNPGMVRGKKRKEKKDGDFELILTDTLIRGDRMTPGFVAPFNKRLRTALCGVLADGMLKAGVRGTDCSDEAYEASPETYRRVKSDRKKKQLVHAISPWGQIYMDKKHQLACSDKKTSEITRKGAKPEQKAWKDCTPGHRDRAAKRHMIKLFIAELYEHWREIEGLPVRRLYQEEYLGHKHGERKGGRAA